jgi:hypothetical protein
MSIYGDDYGKEVLGFQGDPNFYEPYEPVAPPSIDPRYILNPDEGGANDPVGNTSDNYKMPSPYTGSGLTNNFGDITNLIKNSSVLKSLFGDGKGNLDILKLGALGGGALSLLGGNKSSSTPSGYQGSIPKYTATRNMVTAPEAGRRPGAGGTRYGGDVTFTPKGQAPISGGIASLGGSTAPVANPVAPQISKQPVTQDDPFFQSPEYKAFQNDSSNMIGTMDMYDSPYFGRVGSGSIGSAMDRAYEQYKSRTGGGTSDAMRVINPNQIEQPFAEGGLTGRYLQGGTDGMADEIPAQIGEDQPAALSHGEFVIPADVVSHLGNGNSDAGAQKLYDMMDKIREARTGTKEQGKEINPDSFMPGGLAKAYAAGGEVQRFQTGGISGVGTAANAGVTGTESNLSNWAGPYVTDMLGKGQALSEMPYQEYGGPLTAGASNLQNKVFSGLSNVNFPGQLGQSFSSAGAPTIGADGQPVGGGTSPASQYMNPYLQSVLQPQLAELRRQAEITNQSGLGALTKSGAFGGGRQAIMESEAGRNLMQEMNKTVGQGYSSAYDKAMQQFNTEQGQGMGLANLMAGQGGIERGIESEGIAADKTAFEEARANPYKMVQFQQSLLSGLPLAAQSINTAQPSAFANALTGAGSVASLLKNLGLGPTPATPAPKP